MQSENAKPPGTPPPNVIRLGQLAGRLTMLDVACNRCHRAGRRRLAPLLAELGSDYPMTELRRVVAAGCWRLDAGQMTERCGVHFPQLPTLFR